ncbi:aspartate/glutamate racemase family protein [Mesorhizobium sp. M0085]|uniref:aspartate/glutamate racemase family protein n=1 Tax=Mesorhizobium sp. M0085 TaxID=2956872 RepID=UPI00333D6FFD
MNNKILGILELENRPISHLGALCAPETHQFPIKRLTVEGANVARLIAGDRLLKDAYVSAAQELESQGVSAITTNCGFSSLHQAEVAAAVSVPVVLSSLALVPLIAKSLASGRKVGILTYDSTKLGELHCNAAGWSSKEIGVAIGGIEGSPTWERLADPCPDASPELITTDVLAGVKSLLRDDPAVGAVVLECAGFTLAAEAVRRETGLLVADFVTLAKMLIEVSSPGEVERRPDPNGTMIGNAIDNRVLES